MTINNTWKRCHLYVLSLYCCLLSFLLLYSYSWEPPAVFRTIIRQSLVYLVEASNTIRKQPQWVQKLFTILHLEQCREQRLMLLKSSSRRKLRSSRRPEHLCKEKKKESHVSWTRHACLKCVQLNQFILHKILTFQCLLLILSSPNRFHLHQLRGM